jgi:glycosyltransferase involved in cell wall biosynthesis
MEDKLPLISVLVVVRNEERSVSRTLQSILNQDITKNLYEIIVLDGISTDDTRAVVQDVLKDSPVPWRLLDNPGKYLASGWNMGIEAANGQYVVRIDAHAEIPKNFLRMNLEVMKEVGAGCVGGPMETRGQGFWGKMIAGVLSSIFGVGHSFRTVERYEGYTDTVAYGMYKRELLLKIGRFNENMIRNQDWEMHRRLFQMGEWIYFDPRIRSTYYCVDRPFCFIKKSFANGYWVAAIPTKAAIRHLAPFFFITSIMVLAYLCSIRSGSTWYIYRPLRLYLTSYYLLALFFSLDIAAKAGLHALLFGPFLYFSLHCSYGIGTLYGLVSGLWYRVARRKMELQSDGISSE